MKQKRRMWFGVVTAMILLLVIIDFLDLRWRAQEWCDQEDNYLCAKTRLFVNEKRVRYLKSCEGCVLAELDFSSLDLTGVNLRERILMTRRLREQC